MKIQFFSLVSSIRILNRTELNIGNILKAAMQPANVIQKRQSHGAGHVKTIGTHNGKFHCDEVLACFMLKQLPEYRDAVIIRTRDPELLKTCDIVVDVGGEYDPQQLRFDHHQRSFQESMSTLVKGSRYITRLSSAGLVYVHFGKRVIAQILDKSPTDEVVEQLFDKVYENFIEEIDAVDNGIAVNDEPMRYRVTTTVGSRVGACNPSWRDPNPDEMEGFQKALTIVGEVMKDKLHYYANDWWEAYSIVKEAVEKRFEVDPSGEIIELAGGGCPWKEHLAKLEEELDIEMPIKYAIYEDKGGSWRVQTVSVTPDSFQSRLPLRPEWQGVRDNELAEKTGIPTAIFVHATGFIGGAKDRSGALQMARISLGRAT